MEDEYDVIVLGTGLKECILSGLMSVDKKKVLHIDRNGYYGGESASLNLEQLFLKFRPDVRPPAELGRSRDYCIDLCPKFLMATGDLVKVLLYTNVKQYLEFQLVKGSYVFQEGKVHKVPATATEALNSGLMGFFQKRRFRNFLEWVQNYDEKQPKTWSGIDVTKQTMKQVYEYWQLDEHTQQFTGHAIALQQTDDYLNQPAKPMLESIKLYAYSVARYGSSPYIYPKWGLGGLPEGFSRLAAVHGGVYMLNKPVAELVYDGSGKVCGVKDTEGKTARCKQVICDPSYVAGTDKVAKAGTIIRAIAIMSHPIPETNNSDSCQIIIPYTSVKGRRSDIYIFCVSYLHKVVADGKWVAVISTQQESKDEKEAKAEIEPALKLLGKTDDLFVWTSDYFKPTSDGTKDQVFVSASYDSCSHFEPDTVEVLTMYEKITGQKLDLSKSPLVKEGGKDDAEA